MRKILSCSLAAVLLCVTFTGCWDYHGLDELTVVAGIAVDVGDKNPEDYAVTFEVVDVAVAAEPGQSGSKLLKSEGKTLFEAIYNANKQLYNQIYFGNTEIMILSNKIASGEGINQIVEAFFRDFTTRDSLNIIISREDTAGELLEPQKGEQSIVAYRINKSIDHYRTTTNSTQVTKLYEVYDILATGVKNLALPAMSFKPQLSNNGMAIFKRDKLVGYLEDEQMPNYMMAMGHLRGGTYAFFLEGEDKPLDITLEFIKSDPKLDYSYDGERFTLIVKVKALVSAIELAPELPNMYSDTLKQLEERAEQSMGDDIKAMIQGLQKGSGADIFGFGDRVHNYDNKLWNQVGKDWEQHFRDADVQVECALTINDTGLIMQYEAK